MAKGESSYFKNKKNISDRFTDTVFSWSLQDVFNESLFKFKVEKIPESFESTAQYLASYVNPLLEETRAELHSSMEALNRAPFAQVISYEEAKPNGTKVYQVKVDNWTNKNSGGKEPYKTLPGDIFVLAHCKPETVSDLQRVGASWAFLSLVDIRGDGSTIFKVKASKVFEHDSRKQTLYIIFVVNVTPHKRIWEALHMSTNLRIINEILRTNSAVKKKRGGFSKKNKGINDENLVKSLSSKLDESQTGAVLSCLNTIQCKNKSAVELIWGPPGTGKTKTTSTLLVTLLRRNYKILVCAPTNVAITEVASRVLKTVLDAQSTDALFCSLGDILLFGTKERLNISSDIEEIYLDYRVQQLGDCFGPLGWRYCFDNMIDLLTNCVSQYNILLENESTKEGEQTSGSGIEEKICMPKGEVGKKKFTSFLEFVRGRFDVESSELKRCISKICTHTTKSFILNKNFNNMVFLVRLLDAFKSLLCQDDVVSEELIELFSHPAGELSYPLEENTSFLLFLRRNECLSFLKTLRDSLKELDLSSFKSQKAVKKFCFKRAFLIFCTVSSSFKLHNLEVKPTILVIDEAAQLKECESTIPLQLPGLKHAILVGDEWQLPATVKSKISEEAGFGRSLFERLSSQNHSRHLLNVQYRMHPSISIFPNSEFYHNQIRDADIVKRKSHGKQYLPGSMFGSYSFINIIGGKEEREEDGYSRKNMVEVAVILTILQKLYNAWLKSQDEFSIGIVSPYAAQVNAFQKKIGKKYDNNTGFQVKVKTVDGFQGGEEDIIIFSTVRSSDRHSLDFVSKPHRTNVALTRARNCLWILGNERILGNSHSVWGAIIRDAKNRGCFFNADNDEDLAETITNVKKELGQFADMLNPDSILFKSSKWKVFFSDSFLKSFRKLTSDVRKESVIKFLLKLSDGWRRKRCVAAFCESSLQISYFKVEGLSVVFTVDIVQTDSGYMQVLKIWDLLPPENIPEFLRYLNCIFEKYTDDFINICNEKCLEGKIELPKTWPPSLDIVRFKDLGMNGTGSDLVGVASDGSGCIDNSRVSEKSSLPMKFYSLSNCVANHMLSDRDARELDLPFEVPDQEKEIILCDRSAFVLGRSGSGKTTVLTMKLFQKEYLHRMTMEGLRRVKNNVSIRANRNSAAENSKETRGNVLRQLFVTTSPKLCNAVKHHLSYLRSFSCSSSHSAEISLIDMDYIDAEETVFKNVPDLHAIPPNYYPLVITFRNFLMMLDGTLSKSYLERFIGTAELSQSQMCSSRSHALQSFLWTKEVDYKRFCSQYWPHFNSHLTKKLDPSSVFVEITSRIKGGLQSMEASDGKVAREDYVLLSEGCASSFSRKKRKRIYDIFQIYENMKMQNGEFDLADFVNDLHCRLKHETYQGDEMDFVYVDQVQDLTMSQVALFRHVCSNVDEGFVFSGDSIQTIAKGVDFRIQDIRSLFDKKFALEPSKRKHEQRKENGRVTDIFHLTQNFRLHAGILKLLQSIIELLYHFFPLSIDIMEPGTATVNGETPLLLQSQNNENATFTLFRKSENIRRNAVGFGAQQVILVRDESARKKMKDWIGKQALILTVMECKDMEFQDVLLYNFFGSSPLGKQWSVVYKYMKEQDLIDATSCGFPLFDESKHSVLLSELKQLYVVVASTKRRLWIYDETELSEPMFDYWKKKSLVQVRLLDDSLAKAMQVASSSEEWRSRGIELYYEHNYEMATICFEKASDSLWESKSKAAGLEAKADRLRTSDPEEANSALREAAEIFKAIDKADSAARCFYGSGEYEKAGKIYLEIFGDTELRRAGECFSLAGLYELAANVYASRNFFPECVTVCARGKLFDLGLAHIERWKQQDKKSCDVTDRGKEIEKIEQEFLECYALHYYEVNNNKSMMKVVKKFKSMDLIRNFLKQIGCFDELISLEEQWGNFEEAIEISKLKGDELLVADLLGKARKFKEAATAVLSYVLVNSLWSSGKNGWPLKPFKQKDNLLTKAMLFAKNETESFYEFVCAEADIMENKKSDLLMNRNQLNASQRHKSLRGEILCARKILDNHLASKFMEYFFEEDLVIDLVKHSEDMISENRVSVESLVYFWKFWQEKLVGVFEYLGRLETQDVCEFESYGVFCLSFLGVRRQFHDQNVIYVLLNPDADWARNVGKRPVWRDGKLVSIDVCEFVSAARVYWTSEVFSVGFKVLHKLEVLYDFVAKKSDVLFRKCRNLTLIYEVAAFLLDSKFLKRTSQESEDLQKFIRLSTDDFCSYIFPLDWRKSTTENLTLFRETDFCKNFLKQVIVEYTNPRNNLSSGKIGSIAKVILGSGKLDKELLEKILERMDQNPPWKAFFEILSRSRGTYFPSRSLISRSHEALVDAYEVNCRLEFDRISPGCFLYLVDRLLIWASSYQGYFITTKSSFVEWLIHQEIHSNNTWSSSNASVDLQASLLAAIQFVIGVIKTCLSNKGYMIKWLKRYTAGEGEYHSIVVSRMVVIICLLHVNFSMCLDLLFDLLGRSYITEQLPCEFSDCLKPHFLSLNLNVFAEAFKKIDNPLVIVSFGANCSKFSYPDAILVDMEVHRCKSDIMRQLFSKSSEVSEGLSATASMDSPRETVSTSSSTVGKSSDILHSKVTEFVAEQDNRIPNKDESNFFIKYVCFWEIFECINSHESGIDERKFTSNAQTIKVDVEKYIRLLTAAMNGSIQRNLDREEIIYREGMVNMVDELKQLSVALDARNISVAKELSKRLQARRASMERVLDQLFHQHSTDQDNTTVNEVVASSDQCVNEDISAVPEKNSDSSMDKSNVSQASRVPENKAEIAVPEKKEKDGCYIL